jgi:hypothetical protein
MEEPTSAVGSNPQMAPMAPPLPPSVTTPTLRGTPPIASTSMNPAGGPASAPRSAGPWGNASFAGDPMQGLGRQGSSLRFKARVDLRGAFAAILSLLLVAGCFVPFYSVHVANSKAVTTLTVLDNAYPEWRVVILIVSVLCVLVGLGNSVLRVGTSGAVPVFVALRVLVIAQLGLWVYAFVARVPHHASPALSFAVTWEAYAAMAAAFIALAGSLASIGRLTTEG